MSNLSIQLLLLLLGTSSLPLNDQEKKVLNYLTKKLWKDILIFLF